MLGRLPYLRSCLRRKPHARTFDLLCAHREFPVPTTDQLDVISAKTFYHLLETS
jgi:hypothetical protein